MITPQTAASVPTPARSFQPIIIGDYYFIEPQGEVALIKGSVQTDGDLPVNPLKGDCWYVVDLGEYMVFNRNGWNYVTGIRKLSLK